MWPSFSTVLSCTFLAYVLHSTWSIYMLFTPLSCQPHEKCIPAYMQANPKLRLSLFTSTRKAVHSASELNPLWHKEDIDIGQAFETSVNVTLPMQTRNNGSLHVHAFLMPKFQGSHSAAHMLSSPFAYYASCSLTSYLVPQAETFNLLGGNKDGASVEDHNTEEKVGGLAAQQKSVVTHWRRKLSVSIMEDVFSIPSKNIPGEIMKFLKFTPHGEYLPILYIDTLRSRFQDFKEVNKEMEQADLIVSYSPISLGKLRFVSQVEGAMKLMESYGFTEKDLDEVKGVFMDTNLYLLCITFVVAALHLLFDFLAFKNDISFWRQRKNMVGLSTRTLIWRCVSHFIVFLYLMDEQTSLLILVPAGIGSVIEIWKLTKAFKITLNWRSALPVLKFGAQSAEEAKTGEYDAQSMKYLSYLLYPLCLIGAGYSLLYTPHKGWYSWCIQSLVNGVYAFGFLFMLPQLFVNYKHKSVAHLPWRAFTYKAFNTFIDDIFAFIITMPTAHRVACFRDDIVFVVYLYQRWLYPVDKSRINEFGESFEDEINDKVVSKPASKKTKKDQ